MVIKAKKSKKKLKVKMRSKKLLSLAHKVTEKLVDN